MLKLTVAVLTLALAGTACAGGWRSLRIDGSSQAAFEKSLAEFREKLTNGRRYAFTLALNDIWYRGTKEAGRREYTEADYRRELDGLAYEQIVSFTDPTGETARQRRLAFYNAGNAYAEGRVAAGGVRVNQAAAPIGPHGEQVRGTVDTGPAYQHQLRQMGQ